MRHLGVSTSTHRYSAAHDCTDALTDVDAVTQAYTELVGRPPAGVWAAPGRVNLIGEHTDYNDGFVMPFALRPAGHRGRRAARRRHLAGAVPQRRPSRRRSAAPTCVPGMSGWQAYVAGVVWALDEAGHRVGGADLVLTSDVPIGAGLSSSAALECAMLAVLADLDELDDRTDGAGPARPAGRERLRRRPDRPDGPGGVDPVRRPATPCSSTAAASTSSRCRSIWRPPVWSCWCSTPGPRTRWWTASTPRAATSCEAAAAILGVPALRDVDRPRCGAGPAGRRGDAQAGPARGDRERSGCWRRPSVLRAQD